MAGKKPRGARGPDFALTLPQRCLVAGRAFWFYLGKLCWPAHLCFVYPRWQLNPGVWWQWLFPVTAVGTILGLWLARARLGRGPVTAVFFFVGTLFPVLGFMNTYFMRYSFVCDHWVYLPSLGPLALAAALCSGAAEQLRLRWVIYGFTAMVLAVLGILTWRQCGTYADLETLWRTTIARNPNCWLAHNNLGTTLLNQGNLNEAIQHFERALQIKPDSADAFNNLGGALAKQWKLDEAIQYYERALQLKPDDAEAHNNLGVALADQGKLNEAIQHYERALQLDPDYTEAHNNLGIALADQGKLDEAIQHYERVLQLKPDYPEAHNNLGIALANQGKSNEAIQHFERALQLKPDYVEAHYNLGVALADQGKWDEAIQHYERALQLKPDYAEAHCNLGFALAGQGKLNEAIQHYEQALQLKPDYADALINLGNALAGQGKLGEAIQITSGHSNFKPDYPEPHNNLGVALAKQGKLWRPFNITSGRSNSNPITPKLTITWRSRWPARGNRLKPSPSSNGPWPWPRPRAIPRLQNPFARGSSLISRLCSNRKHLDGTSWPPMIFPLPRLSFYPAVIAKRKRNTVFDEQNSANGSCPLFLQLDRTKRCNA